MGKTKIIKAQYARFFLPSHKTCFLQFHDNVVIWSTRCPVILTYTGCGELVTLVGVICSITF
ncbi:hypothetical protein Hanom_Chr06g00532601 [Helianthus anomalus]